MAKRTSTMNRARDRRLQREMLNGFMTARQAAQYKGCSEKAVYEAIQGGRLIANRVGPVWLVSRKAIDEWVLIGHRPAKPQRSTILCSEETALHAESSD